MTDKIVARIVIGYWVFVLVAVLARMCSKEYAVARGVIMLTIFIFSICSVISDLRRK